MPKAEAQESHFVATVPALPVRVRQGTSNVMRNRLEIL
jgi:hypothetical protein